MGEEVLWTRIFYVIQKKWYLNFDTWTIYFISLISEQKMTLVIYDMEILIRFEGFCCAQHYSEKFDGVIQFRIVFSGSSEGVCYQEVY